MQRGTELLALLNKYGDWIVIHGHKHHAKISYSAGGSKRSVVFAAGTLSSHKALLGEDGFQNQFYILRIHKTKIRGGLKGTVQAWSWKGNQWSISKSIKDGIFTGVGFGLENCIEDLAERISNDVSNPIPVDWEKLKETHDDLNYLMPTDYEHLKEELSNFDIDINYNDDGEIESLSKTEKAT